MNLSQGIFGGVSNESIPLFYRTYNISNEKIVQRANKIRLRLSQDSDRAIETEKTQKSIKFVKRKQYSNTVGKGEEILKKILNIEEKLNEKVMRRSKNSHSTNAILEEVRNEEQRILSQRIVELNENFAKSAKYLEERVLSTIEKERRDLYGEISIYEHEAKEAIEKRSISLIDELFPKSIKSFTKPEEKQKIELRKKLNLIHIQSKSNSSLFEVLKGKNEVERIRFKLLNK